MFQTFCWHCPFCAFAIRGEAKVEESGETKSTILSLRDDGTELRIGILSFSSRCLPTRRFILESNYSYHVLLKEQPHVVPYFKSEYLSLEIPKEITAIPAVLAPSWKGVPVLMVSGPGKF